MGSGSFLPFPALPPQPSFLLQRKIPPPSKGAAAPPLCPDGPKRTIINKNKRQFHPSATELHAMPGRKDLPCAGTGGDPSQRCSAPPPTFPLLPSPSHLPLPTRSGPAPTPPAHPNAGGDRLAGRPRSGRRRSLPAPPSPPPRRAGPRGVRLQTPGSVRRGLLPAPQVTCGTLRPVAAPRNKFPGPAPAPPPPSSHLRHVRCAGGRAGAGPGRGHIAAAAEEETAAEGRGLRGGGERREGGARAGPGGAPRCVTAHGRRRGGAGRGGAVARARARLDRQSRRRPRPSPPGPAPSARPVSAAPSRRRSGAERRRVLSVGGTARCRPRGPNGPGVAPHRANRAPAGVTHVGARKASSHRGPGEQRRARRCGGPTERETKHKTRPNAAVPKAIPVRGCGSAPRGRARAQRLRVRTRRHSH